MNGSRFDSICRASANRFEATEALRAAGLWDEAAGPLMQAWRDLPSRPKSEIKDISDTHWSHWSEFDYMTEPA